ncbi:unnamed protein product [Paramecium primaurelia]|uniref:Uncharacterized protein n=2 Tax=Paramecium TaxID=5884 RepID=A0A8S1W7S0_9CILI|nr:unnamed protein product [Paramecium primaurelia]CAD8185411.1 unnamed protein product [Paramecium pentaurelia]
MLDPFRMATVRRQSELIKSNNQLIEQQPRGRQQCANSNQHLTDIVNQCIQRSQHSIDALQQIRARSKDRRSSYKKTTRQSTISSFKGQTSPSFRQDDQSVTSSIQESQQSQLPVRLFSFIENEPSFRAKDMPLQINKSSLEAKKKPLIQLKENQRRLTNIDQLFQEALRKSQQITEKFYQ